MYSAAQLAIKFLNYYWTASNGKGHGIHSPFIFHFITRVLNDKTTYDAYDRVESLRRQLLTDKTTLTVEDFGAGSAANKSNRRTIASIAKHAAKPAKYGQLLFRMAKEYQPGTILELGTSLGISTSYLSLAKPGARLITLEGAPELANAAVQNFKTLQLNNISLVPGNFDETLPGVIERVSAIDLAFIDGNHRREPTERYFLQILSKTTNDSIIIFDDIHWSKEMEAAWETVKAHPAVRSSIDLFFIGIVFFREEFREKQHFKIRF